MSFISALFAVVGFVSGLISIYLFATTRTGTRAHNRSILGIIVATVLLVSFLLTYFSSNINTNSPSKTSTQTIAPPTTTQAFSPTPTPSPTPIPTPTPFSYHSNWSNGMDGWTQSDGWNSVNGMLVNDGSDYNNDGHPTAIAPHLPQGLTNYSVQTDIRLDKYSDEGGFSGLAGFGLVVRSPDNVGGYKIGVCVSAGIYSCGNANHEVLLSDGSFFQDTPVKQAPFRPDYGTWHTYRIDVQGNAVTAWIDNGMIFQTTDDKYLAAGSVGLWSDRSQISVRNFKISAL